MELKELTNWGTAIAAEGSQAWIRIHREKVCLHCNVTRSHEINRITSHTENYLVRLQVMRLCSVSQSNDQSVSSEQLGAWLSCVREETERRPFV